MQDWLTATAAMLGQRIATGDIDPVELTQAYLDAIAAHPFADRIYARTTPDRALAEAEAARQRANDGHRLSPLDGVPISWKDLFDSSGIATEAGSALLKEHIPIKDAEVLRNATAMGLVCLGKTHMSELAFSGLGHNPVTATSPCINNHDAVSGGSSSGAAASVAFNLAAGAVGSDTGGSVRIPAAWNDLVGLKTTSGRVSLNGVVPLCLEFDTVGPLTRDVTDAAFIFAALEGRKAPDLTGATLKGKRFAALQTFVLDNIEDNPRRAYDDAMQRLRDAGAVIEPIDVPEVHDAMALAGILFTTEAYGLWKDKIEANPDLMFSEILARFRSGANHSGADYVAAWASLRRYRAAWMEKTAGFDAILCPSSPLLPPELKRLEEDSEFYQRNNLLALSHTRIGNLMGLSAITLSTRTPSCGIMFMGAPMAEDALLRTAKAAEDALT